MEKLTPKKLYSSTSDKICCLCITESKSNFKLFIIAGKGRNISKKIEIVTVFTILESECLTVICHKCDRFVGSVISFKNHCYENQLKLQQTVSVKQIISPAKVPEKVIYKENKQTSKKKLLYGADKENGNLTELQINIQPKKMSTKFVSIAQYNLNLFIVLQKIFSLLIH